jgi:hypothetical protein
MRSTRLFVGDGEGDEFTAELVKIVCDVTLGRSFIETDLPVVVEIVGVTSDIDTFVACECHWRDTIDDESVLTFASLAFDLGHEPPAGYIHDCKRLFAVHDINLSSQGIHFSFVIGDLEDDIIGA